MKHVRNYTIAKEGKYNILPEVADFLDYCIPLCLACAFVATKWQQHNVATKTFESKIREPSDFVSIINRS